MAQPLGGSKGAVTRVVVHPSFVSNFSASTNTAMVWKRIIPLLILDDLSAGKTNGVFGVTGELDGGVVVFNSFPLTLGQAMCCLGDSDGSFFGLTSPGT